MERSKLPNKEEFDKIVKAAFASDERHCFSEHYRQKKDNIQRGIIMKKSKTNKSERIFVGAVAAAVIAVVAVPTGVVIKNKINPEIVPGTDDAAVVLEATNPDESSANQANIGDAENREIIEESPKTYEFGWLPEGMSFDYPNYEGKAHRESDDAGVTPMLYKYAPGQELLPMNIHEYDNVDRYDLDGRHIDIFYMPGFRHTVPNAFNRNVWITFDGSQYAVFLYVNDCVDDDELAQIIENISLVPAEEDYANIYTEPTYEVPSTEPAEVSAVVPDELNLMSVGDTITRKRNVYEDHTTVMDITVNDAFYTNNFNDLTTDNIGCDFDYSAVTDILNDDGTLADLYTEWYDYDTAGDKFTKDYETVGVKVLILDLTFTNKSDAKDDYCIASQMATFINGTPHYLDDADRITSSQYYANYYTNYDQIISERDLPFSFVTDSDNFKNHIILDPGESANVRLAFLIKETEVGNLYLNIAPNNSGDINELQKGNPILDLCNIPEKE